MEDQYQKPVLGQARKRRGNETQTFTYEEKSIYAGMGNGKHYYIQTHGCQGNEADSEKLKGLLESVGYVETMDEEIADLVIINTCAIREHAEAKVFGEIGRFKKRRRENKDFILAIGGCMSQEEVVVERLLKTYRHVDIIFGTHNLHRLLEFIHVVMVEKRRVVEVLSVEGDIVENVPTARDSRFKAWVNIMYGCDEFCTYCIVPYTRGKERSRRPHHILEEIHNLANQGYQEVTLLGQNVNSYGLDLDDGSYGFAELLEAIQHISIPRVRFTTSHPKDFSDKLIEVLSRKGNLMPYIHLPVQSGSNVILERMNRKYTQEEYRLLVQKIRNAIPDVSITTDIIVGFPGETEEDFENTLNLVEQCGFEGAYTFIFSPRAGTPAAKYPDTLSMAEKKRRLLTLNQLVNEGFAKGNQRFLGETVEVLIEGPSKTDPNTWSGYTPHNKLVHVKNGESYVGKRVFVKINVAKTWSLEGEICG
ncbi:MAG: tRNA (N6-isopentenyl adenosine(37)-C2)-methylthiotransferase MiaB [Candidatus Izemoplasmatales bacterium]